MGEERRVGGGRGLGLVVVVVCSEFLLNNKAVVDPWSPILCSECRQCVVMFFITTANLQLSMCWTEMSCVWLDGALCWRCLRPAVWAPCLEDLTHGTLAADGKSSQGAL